MEIIIITIRGIFLKPTQKTPFNNFEISINALSIENIFSQVLIYRYRYIERVTLFIYKTLNEKRLKLILRLSYQTSEISDVYISGPAVLCDGVRQRRRLDVPDPAVWQV